jgi:head-tail adaptor
MPRLRSGSLRQRIEIQSASEAQDAYGAVSFSWSTDNTRWGSIQQLSADERKNHDQLEGSNVVKITLRFYDGLAITNRFKYGTRIFNIVSVNNEWERDHVTTAIAVEEQ